MQGLVAVGRALAGRLSHRSGHAALPHVMRCNTYYVGKAHARFGEEELEIELFGHYARSLLYCLFF
jgi:hypothetical protein